MIDQQLLVNELCDMFLSKDNIDGCDERENAVDAIGRLIRQVESIAIAITPPSNPARDAADGYVSSLTEAIMGVTASGMAIAHAIDNLAEAIREQSND